MSTFATTLVSLRQMKGLSRLQLATELQCRPEQVYSWETSRALPPTPKSGHMVHLRRLFGKENASRLCELSRNERVSFTLSALGRHEWERDALRAFRVAWVDNQIDETTAAQLVALLERKT